MIGRHIMATAMSVSIVLHAAAGNAVLPDHVRIQPGDSLSKLKQRYGLNAKQLAQLNPELFRNGRDRDGRRRSADGRWLYPGDVLRLRAPHLASAKPVPPRAPAPEPSPRPRVSRGPSPAVEKKPPPEAPPDEAMDERFLEVRFLENYILSEALTAYMHSDGIRLPLGELATLLSLGITVDPERGQAGGFIVSENRRFRLDLQKGEVWVGEKRYSFQPDALEVREEDLYVDSRLLSLWLPVTIEPELNASRLQITPRETLPMQARLERENRKLATLERATDSGFSRVDSPYRLWDGPFIDQELSLNVSQASRQSPQGNLLFATFATAETLYLSSALYLSGSNQTPLSNVRLTMGRKDPDPVLLGPLQAREFAFGEVSVPGLPLVSNSLTGVGAMVGNYPLHQATQFSTHRFRGVLLPGWEVELYQNEALLGYQQASTSGTYLFENIALLSGMNEFKLVFYGPQGERREEIYRLNVAAGLNDVGEHRYRLATQQKLDGHGLSQAQYQLGLMPGLTSSLGLLSDGGRLYSHLGLRGFWNAFYYYGDAAVAPDGGLAGELGVQGFLSPLDVTVRHNRLHHYQSEMFRAQADPLKTRTMIRLGGARPLLMDPMLTSSLDLQRDEQASGLTPSRISHRLGLGNPMFSVSNQLDWEFGQAGAARDGFKGGVLQLGSRWRQAGIRGYLEYTPEQVASLTLSGGLPLPHDLHVDLGVQHQLTTQLSLTELIVSKKIEAFSTGLTARLDSQGNVAFGLRLQTILGMMPAQGRWHGARSIANTGAAQVRVFLDTDRDGQRGADEPLLEDVGIQLNGGTFAKTNADGLARLEGLPSHQPVDLTLDLSTLPDLSWVPSPKGIRLVPRPGSTMVVDLPAIMTGEISGKTWIRRSSGLVEASEVQLEILDSEGKIVWQGASEFDGFFYAAELPLGTYTLRVSPEQLARLKLPMPRQLRLDLSAQTPSIDDAEITLEGRP